MVYIYADCAQNELSDVLTYFDSFKFLGIVVGNGKN